MLEIINVKGYDQCGYEVMNFEFPTVNEATQNLIEWGKGIQSIGISAYEATESLKRISDLLYRMERSEDEITAIEDKLADLENKINSQDVALSNRIDAAEIAIDELRPVSVEEIETPNQKSDLEIFSRIVPSEDFLILGDVRWSSDIIKLDQTNMFLN